MSAPVRWGDALTLAARLGISPEAFWRLSVVEWRAVAAPRGGEPLSRADLESLMRRHPDGEIDGR